MDMYKNLCKQIELFILFTVCPFLICVLFLLLSVVSWQLMNKFVNLSVVSWQLLNKFINSLFLIFGLMEFFLLYFIGYVLIVLGRYFGKKFLDTPKRAIIVISWLIASLPIIIYLYSYLGAFKDPSSFYGEQGQGIYLPGSLPFIFLVGCIAGCISHVRTIDLGEKVGKSFYNALATICLVAQFILPIIFSFITRFIV